MHQESPIGAIADRNPCALARVADADGDDADAALGRSLGGIHGIAAHVLAIREDHDRVAGIVGGEALGGEADRVAEHRPAASRVLRLEAVHCSLERVVVQGERRAHCSDAREVDESRAVAAHGVDGIGDECPGALEPVRSGILGKHRPAHVDHEHHVRAAPSQLLGLLGGARVHQGHSEARGRAAKQRCAPDPAGERQARRDSRQQGGIGEARRRAPAPQRHAHSKQRDGHGGDQPERASGIVEVERHSVIPGSNGIGWRQAPPRRAAGSPRQRGSAAMSGRRR